MADDLPAMSDIERDSSEMSASARSQSRKTHSETRTDDTTSSVTKPNQQHWRSGAVPRVYKSTRMPEDQPNWRSGAVPRVYKSTRTPEDQPNTRNEAVSGTHSRASDDPSVRQRALPLTESNSPRNKVGGSSRMPDDQQNWRSRRLESPLKDTERHSSGQKQLDISAIVDDQSNRGQGRGHSGNCGRGGHGWRARGTQASGTSRGFQERSSEQHQIKTVVARIDSNKQQNPDMFARYAEEANISQGMEGQGFRARGRHALSTTHKFHSRSVEAHQMSTVDVADGEEHQRCPETKYTGRSGQQRGRSRG